MRFRPSSSRSRSVAGSRYPVEHVKRRSSDSERARHTAAGDIGCRRSHPTVPDDYCRPRSATVYQGFAWGMGSTAIDNAQLTANSDCDRMFEGDVRFLKPLRLSRLTVPTMPAARAAST